MWTMQRTARRRGAADALASPAAQNFGSYQYYDENGKATKYNYVDYA